MLRKLVWPWKLREGICYSAWGEKIGILSAEGARGRCAWQVVQQRLQGKKEDRRQGCLALTTWAEAGVWHLETRDMEIWPYSGDKPQWEQEIISHTCFPNFFGLLGLVLGWQQDIAEGGRGRSRQVGGSVLIDGQELVSGKHVIPPGQIWQWREDRFYVSG